MIPPTSQVGLLSTSGLEDKWDPMSQAKVKLQQLKEHRRRLVSVSTDEVHVKQAAGPGDVSVAAANRGRNSFRSFRTDGSEAADLPQPLQTGPSRETSAAPTSSYGSAPDHQENVCHVSEFDFTSLSSGRADDDLAPQQIRILGKLRSIGGKAPPPTAQRKIVKKGSSKPSDASSLPRLGVLLHASRSQTVLRRKAGATPERRLPPTSAAPNLSQSVGASGRRPDVNAKGRRESSDAEVGSFHRKAAHRAAVGGADRSRRSPGRARPGPLRGEVATGCRTESASQVGNQRAALHHSSAKEVSASRLPERPSLQLSERHLSKPSNGPKILSQSSIESSVDAQKQSRGRGSSDLPFSKSAASRAPAVKSGHFSVHPFAHHRENATDRPSRTGVVATGVWDGLRRNNSGETETPLNVGRESVESVVTLLHEPSSLVSQLSPSADAAPWMESPLSPQISRRPTGKRPAHSLFPAISDGFKGRKDEVSGGDRTSQRDAVASALWRPLSSNKDEGLGKRSGLAQSPLGTSSASLASLQSEKGFWQKELDGSLERDETFVGTGDSIAQLLSDGTISSWGDTVETGSVDELLQQWRETRGLQGFFDSTKTQHEFWTKQSPQPSPQERRRRMGKTTRHRRVEVPNSSRPAPSLVTKWLEASARQMFTVDSDRLGGLRESVLSSPSLLDESGHLKRGHAVELISTLSDISRTCDSSPLSYDPFSVDPETIVKHVKTRLALKRGGNVGTRTKTVTADSWVLQQHGGREASKTESHIATESSGTSQLHLSEISAFSGLSKSSDAVHNSGYISLSKRPEFADLERRARADGPRGLNHKRIEAASQTAAIQSAFDTPAFSSADLMSDLMCREEGGSLSLLPSPDSTTLRRSEVGDELDADFAACGELEAFEEQRHANPLLGKQSPVPVMVGFGGAEGRIDALPPTPKSTDDATPAPQEVTTNLFESSGRERHGAVRLASPNPQQQASGSSAIVIEQPDSPQGPAEQRNAGKALQAHLATAESLGTPTEIPFLAPISEGRRRSLPSHQGVIDCSNLIFSQSAGGSQGVEKEDSLCYSVSVACSHLPSPRSSNGASPTRRRLFRATEAEQRQALAGSHQAGAADAHAAFAPASPPASSRIACSPCRIEEAESSLATCVKSPFPKGASSCIEGESVVLDPNGGAPMLQCHGEEQRCEVRPFPVERGASVGHGTPSTSSVGAVRGHNVTGVENVETVVLGEGGNDTRETRDNRQQPEMAKSSCATNGTATDGAGQMSVHTPLRVEIETSEAKPLPDQPYESSGRIKQSPPAPLDNPAPQHKGRSVVAPLSVCVDTRKAQIESHPIVNSEPPHALAATNSRYGGAESLEEASVSAAATPQVQEAKLRGDSAFPAKHGNLVTSCTQTIKTCQQATGWTQEDMLDGVAAADPTKLAAARGADRTGRRLQLLYDEMQQTDPAQPAQQRAASGRVFAGLVNYSRSSKRCISDISDSSGSIDWQQNAWCAEPDFARPEDAERRGRKGSVCLGPAAAPPDSEVAHNDGHGLTTAGLLGCPGCHHIVRCHRRGSEELPTRPECPVCRHCQDIPFIRHTDVSFPPLHTSTRHSLAGRAPLRDFPGHSGRDREKPPYLASSSPRPPPESLDLYGAGRVECNRRLHRQSSWGWQRIDTCRRRSKIRGTRTAAPSLPVDCHKKDGGVVGWSAGAEASSRRRRIARTTSRRLLRRENAASSPWTCESEEASAIGSTDDDGEEGDTPDLHLEPRIGSREKRKSSPAEAARRSRFSRQTARRAGRRRRTGLLSLAASKGFANATSSSHHDVGCLVAGSSLSGEALSAASPSARHIDADRKRRSRSCCAEGFGGRAGEKDLARKGDPSESTIRQWVQEALDEYMSHQARLYRVLRREFGPQQDPP